MTVTLRFTAQVMNIELEDGDDLVLDLTFADVDDDGNPGMPIPVDLWDIAAQVRGRENDVQPLAWFAVDMTDAIHGRVTLTLPGGDVRTRLGRWQHWDLQRVLDGNTRTLVKGVIVKDLDVTR